MDAEDETIEYLLPSGHAIYVKSQQPFGAPQPIVVTTVEKFDEIMKLVGAVRMSTAAPAP